VTSVGLKVLGILDAGQRATSPAYFLYPAHAAARRHHFGPNEISAALDGPVAGSDLRLVVLSHGSGSPWTPRHLAADLARSGFVACLLEHIGNCRRSWRFCATASRHCHCRVCRGMQCRLDFHLA